MLIQENECKNINSIDDLSPAQRANIEDCLRAKKSIVADDFVTLNILMQILPYNNNKGVNIWNA